MSSVPLTNDLVQATVAKALEALRPLKDAPHANEAERLRNASYRVAYEALDLFALRSESGNSIPGLGGLGLHEAYEFATAVLAGAYETRNGVPIHFRLLFDGLG